MIYVSGTRVVSAISRIVFRVELSLPMLLGFGFVVGTVLFFLDRWIARCLKNESKKTNED